MSYIAQKYNQITQTKTNFFQVADLFLFGYYGFLILLIMLIIYFPYVSNDINAIITFILFIMISTIFLSVYILCAQQEDCYDYYLNKIDQVAHAARKKIISPSLSSNQSVQTGLNNVQNIKQKIESINNHLAQIIQQHENIRTARIDNDLTTIESYNTVIKNILQYNDQIKKIFIQHKQQTDQILHKQQEQYTQLQELYQTDQNNNPIVAHNLNKLSLLSYFIDINKLDTIKTGNNKITAFGYDAEYKNSKIHKLYLIHPALFIDVNQSFKELIDNNNLYKKPVVQDNNFIYNNNIIYPSAILNNTNIKINDTNDYYYLEHERLKILYMYNQDICFVLSDSKCYIINSQGAICFGENIVTFYPFSMTNNYSYQKSDNSNQWDLITKVNTNNTTPTILKQFVIEFDNNSSLIYNNWKHQEDLRAQTSYKGHIFSNQEGTHDLIIKTSTADIILTINLFNKNVHITQL